MTETSIRGYLVVTVAEASGRNKEEDDVWDPGFYEGYVKVEVRGPGVPTCKSSSSIKRVLSGQISWQEDIVCEVLEGASELRVMLCKQKRNARTGALGQSVVAACGIYVEDIIDAVPIDKYFELFKPKEGGDGGFIRVAINFSSESPEDAADTEAAPYVPSTSFKSYSKEHTAAASNGRSNAAVAIDNDPIDNDTIDNDTIDSDEASKPADDSGSIDRDTMDHDTIDHDTIDSDDASQSVCQPGGSPGPRRRIPLGKILIAAAVAVSFVVAQRRQ